MSQIIKIEGTTVYIGTDDGNIIETPIATVNYYNPQVGDQVNIFKNDDMTVITLTQTAKQTAELVFSDNGSEKKIEKNIFVWVATFLAGSFGVDRFMRGQIPLGVIKLLTGGGLGVWTLIDFIIAVTKAYGNEYANETHFVFVNGEYIK